MSEADDKKLPELDLRLTEENPDDLYEHAPCGYCSCLPDGTLVKLNQTLLDWLGYQREELIARQSLLQLLTVGGRLHYEMHCTPLLLLQGEVREVSYSLRRHDGSTLPVLLNATLRRDAGGEPLVVRVTLFNITERRKYEQELLRAKTEAEEQREQLRTQNEQLTLINADLDSFVYTASHDLKQPIHNLTGLFEEFKRVVTFHDSAAASMLVMFDEALCQILTTVEALANVMQQQRQLEQAPTETVALQPFTEGLIAGLPHLPNEAAAAFTLDFSAAPLVQMPRASLQSILCNLLSNALRYAQPGRRPQITVRSGWSDNLLLIRVTDNGRGIDLARHGKELFQLFQRFHPDVPGSGVGLYIVNRLVYQAGGRLEVTSVVGQGTTFSMLLPQQSGQAPPKKSRAAGA